MFRITRSALLLLALAMGISLTVPCTSFPKEIANVLSGTSEEEVHAFHGMQKFHPGSHHSWRIASLLLTAATEEWRATHSVMVHQGPVSEVPVPPPKSAC